MDSEPIIRNKLSRGKISAVYCMLGGNRRKLAATIGLALAGLAALALLGLAVLYSYREFYEPAERDHTVQRYQPARDATKPLPSVGGRSAPKVHDPHCEQPLSHDDADLCAQWSAVQAVSETNRLTRIGLRLAAVGFWVAFLGGLLSFFGTAFLVLTFRENKRAADAAHGANRPWLQLRNLHCPEVVFCPPREGVPDGRIGARVTGTATNKGNSPATRVEALLVVYATPTNAGPAVEKNARDHLRARLVSPLAEGEAPYVVFPNEDFNFDLVASTEDQCVSGSFDMHSGGIFSVHVLIGVRYEYEGRARYTIAPLDIVGLPTPSGENFFKTGVITEGTYSPEPYRFSLIEHWQNREAT